MQMKGGYTDGHKGEWIATPQEIRAATKLYWDAGYQIHIHVNGDLGLDVVLDALERCMRENPRYDHRSVLVHFANSTDEQVARIARLGAIVERQPLLPDRPRRRYGKEGLGPERADAMVRLGFARPPRRADLAPLRPAHGPGRPALSSPGAPSIAPRPRAGSPARTSGSASSRPSAPSRSTRPIRWRMEQEMGSIAPGKVANFTVLEDDPLTVDPMKLKDIRIWGTVFEGRVFPIEK